MLVSEECLLGRSQHCAHPRLDQDRRHLPRPGADKRLRAQGRQGSHQGVPAHPRKDLTCHRYLAINAIFELPLI